MEERHVAGAAIAVVKDGRIFLTKGYGYADLENGVPVDPDETIFRIGSVGKTLTWTAVMQLAEQGKLDLDADVNTYLDFRIPDTYPQPITLKHLMTHTSGFEERWLESLAEDDSELVPAGEWLASNMAARVHPPGETAGYSNYNAMLAGYIVSRVSGQPYEQYIQEHIFDPLGMAHSTAGWPVPPALREDLSVGYTYVDGALQPFISYVPQPALLPSGVHRSTVTDMARYMIAHLGRGRYSDEEIAEARVLDESTARQMQTTLYTPDSRLLGSTYGFADVSENGHRALAHQGYSAPMEGQLLLLPEHNLGIYWVSNTGGVGDLATQHTGFQKAFFDHYFPVAAAEPLQPPADFAERAGRFVGFYRLASYPASTADKIARVFGPVQVSDSGDGALLLSTHGLELRFVEVGPLYFRQVDGPFALVFREDDRGRITYLFTDLQPQYGAVKMPWYETLSFSMTLALGCVLVFLSVLPIALIRAFRSRRHNGAEPRNARVAGWVIIGVCLLNLLFLAGFALFFHPPTELHGIATSIKLVMSLGVMAALLTAGALVYTVLAWKDNYWSVPFRVYYSLVTVAAVAFVWLLNYWNFLGWQF
jgi:CubicO group peptidase (beta-lactamase class C family)